MKIVYIYSTLATTGGTEKMIIEKANYLAEHFGYDVTIITCFQRKYENNFIHQKKSSKFILRFHTFHNTNTVIPKDFGLNGKLTDYYDKAFTNL